jgi:hypothetical protein
MKKVFWMALVATAFVGLFLTGGVALAEEVPITPENISQLVGNWEGTREFMGGGRFPKAQVRPVTLEITNDPLKAVITYQGGGQSVPLEVEIKDGKICLKGKIQTCLVLDISGGKLKLEGGAISSALYTFKK